MDGQAGGTIYVTGLVFDFCVKETALFGREHFPNNKLLVLANLARASCDGVPGAPFICGETGINGKNVHVPGICKEGDGTLPFYHNVMKDYKAHGVTLAQYAIPATSQN